MPIKIKHAFEKEYGKKKGDIIFYKWESKHGIHHKKHDANLKKRMLRY